MHGLKDQLVYSGFDDVVDSGIEQVKYPQIH